MAIVKKKDTFKLNAEAKEKPRVPERARRVLTKLRKNLVHMEITLLEIPLERRRGMDRPKWGCMLLVWTPVRMSTCFETNVSSII